MRLMLPLALAVVLASPLEAQRPPSRCVLDPPDSALLRAGPLYRDCEVDRLVRRRGAEPPLALHLNSVREPREGCYITEFTFVVDTTGQVEDGTIERRRMDMPEIGQAIEPTITDLRFEPAMKGGQRVRQLVLYRRGVAIAAQRPAGQFNPPLPRC